MPLDDETPNVRNKPHTRPEVAKEKETVVAAHDQATKDMEEDTDLNRTDPDGDLDEGEVARLKGKDGTYPQ